MHLNAGFIFRGEKRGEKARKTLQVVNSITSAEGSFRDRQLHPSRDDKRVLFFRALRSSLREPFSHNSNYPRRPARALLPDVATARIN